MTPPQAAATRARHIYACCNHKSDHDSKMFRRERASRPAADDKELEQGSTAKKNRREAMNRRAKVTVWGQALSRLPHGAHFRPEGMRGNYAAHNYAIDGGSPVSV